MAAAVLPFRPAIKAHSRAGSWSLLEVCEPGRRAEPWGILLLSEEGALTLRLRESTELAEDTVEQETDLLDFLAEDLLAKSREQGGHELLAGLEDSLSGFLRIGNRTAIAWTGDPQSMADELFDTHVDRTVRPYATHLPCYELRAAATKFGEERFAEEMTSGYDTSANWVRTPRNLRLSSGMFVAQVVGRSMEPVIPDGAWCIFRAPVTGSRQGRRLLIEQFGQTDFANRYTVKRYTSRKQASQDSEWEHTRIRLEPLNPDFEAFDLGPDQFRVVAEFVGPLHS